MQPLNIAVVSGKGGIGKTNTSLILFEAFRHVGKTVGVVDWDDQGTLTKALRIICPEAFDSRGRYTPPDAPDVVIWDTPPELNTATTAAALQQADIILVLTTPNFSEMWEAEDSVRFAEKKKKAGAVVRAFYNKVRKGTILSRDIDTSQPVGGAACLSVVIQSRENYNQFPAIGWAGLDSATKQEVLEFAVSVASLPRPTA